MRNVAETGNPGGNTGGKNSLYYDESEILWIWIF